MCVCPRGPGTLLANKQSLDVLRVAMVRDDVLGRQGTPQHVLVSSASLSPLRPLAKHLAVAVVVVAVVVVLAVAVVFVVVTTITGRSNQKKNEKSHNRRRRQT